MSEKDGGLLLRLRFPARANQLRRVRQAVREQTKASGCSEQCSADVVLAIDEACQNVIRHAYGNEPSGEIVLEIERRGEELVFSLRDFAPPIDPACVKPRDLDDVRPGGLGTHFIQKVMDEMEFVPPPSGGGNLLRMVKRIE
jgi:sigma-B regulation protein RsbU (phosphoserine phosphatase)